MDRLSIARTALGIRHININVGACSRAKHGIARWCTRNHGRHMEENVNMLFRWIC